MGAGKKKKRIIYVWMNGPDGDKVEHCMELTEIF